MADEFNTEELLIKVTAEDDASQVLEQVDKNLKKFTDNDKKVEYLTKQLAKFENQMRGVNSAIKKGQTVKFKEPLEKVISGTKKKLDILKPVETSTHKKPKTLTPIKKEGEVYKTKVDEATKATKTWTKETVENGKKIVRTYGQIANKFGELEEKHLSTETFYPKKLNRENILGDIVSEDAVRGVVTTQQIDENGKKIVRTYKEAVKVGEKWQGVLASAKETQLKMPPPLIRENLQGKLLSKNTTKGTAITEEIVKGKKVRRVYSDIMETSSGLVGVLKDENEVLLKNTSLWNKLKNTGKNFLTPFGRIGRIFQSIIAFRLASSVITVTVNAFKKGFEALKQSSKETADLFLPFQTSLNSISISLATIVLPLIQSLTTILEPFAEKMTAVANAMALANAEAEGQSKYFKLSSDKIKEYTKSAQQANKQLSQLDKFATLSGNKTTPLGDWVEINEETKKQQEEESEPYKDSINNTTDFIKSLKDLINTIKELDTTQALTIVSLLSGLASLVSPFGRIASLLVNFSILSSDASREAKSMAQAMIALSFALIGLGIAKQFFKSPMAGVIAASAGAIVGLGISSIVARNADNKHSQSTNYEQGYASSAINDIATANSQRPVNLTANVNMDGKRVGELTANSVRDTWKKNGWY